MDLPVWAGVIPIKQQFGPMEAVEVLNKEIITPDYSKVYGKRWVSK